MPKPSVQIEAVARLERDLATARQRAAVALRRMREQREMSLRQVAPHVELSPAGLSLLERGETWETSTARRVLAFYRRETAAAVA